MKLIEYNESRTIVESCSWTFYDSSSGREYIYREISETGTDADSRYHELTWKNGSIYELIATSDPRYAELMSMIRPDGQRA